MCEGNAFSVVQLVIITITVVRFFGRFLATDVKRDAMADFFPEVLHQLVAGHEALEGDPRHVFPLLRVAMQEPIPGHAFAADRFVFDLLSRFGVGFPRDSL